MVYLCSFWQSSQMLFNHELQMRSLKPVLFSGTTVAPDKSVLVVSVTVIAAVALIVSALVFLAVR